MINNTTIQKLNYKEIGELGLNNKGIYTYRGELKSRKQGFKKTLDTENEVHFEIESIRFEAIKIEALGETPEWAMRMYDKANEKYEDFWLPLYGCEFFK